MAVRHRFAVLRLVELGLERVAPGATPPAVRGVADDREQPGPRAPFLSTPEPPEIAERAEARLLGDVLRVVVVACEVARQGVPGVQVRQDHGFESRELA